MLLLWHFDCSDSGPPIPFDSLVLRVLSMRSYHILRKKRSFFTCSNINLFTPRSPYGVGFPCCLAESIRSCMRHLYDVQDATWAANTCNQITTASQDIPQPMATLGATGPVIRSMMETIKMLGGLIRHGTSSRLQWILKMCEGHRS